MRKTLLQVLGLGLGLLAGLDEAAAQAGRKPMRWQSHWARFGVGDVAVSAAFGGTGLAAVLAPTSVGSRRNGGILFDDAVRDALPADSDSLRPVARASSDVVVGTLIATPFLLDAVALAGVRHRSADVALQMALIDAEAMAMVVGIHGVTSLIAARERPYGAECGRSLDATSSECTSDRRYRSFFSSHTAHAFNSAGLVCAHHMQLRLFGSGPADAATCATALVAASAVGAFRVAGDMHWTSDVVIGAGVGLAIGLGVPLLHYHGGIPTLELARRGRDGTRVSLVPSANGLAVAGIF